MGPSPSGGARRMPAHPSCTACPLLGTPCGGG